MTYFILAFIKYVKSIGHMRYLFYSLLITLLFLTILMDDKNLRKDEYCKEGLFYQFILKQCTPRKFLYDENKQVNI